MTQQVSSVSISSVSLVSPHLTWRIVQSPHRLRGETRPGLTETRLRPETRFALEPRLQAAPRSRPPPTRGLNVPAELRQSEHEQPHHRRSRRRHGRRSHPPGLDKDHAASVSRRFTVAADCEHVPSNQAPEHSTGQAPRASCDPVTQRAPILLSPATLPRPWRFAPACGTFAT